jgi:hypothetical protein
VRELERIALADPAMAFGPDGSLLELNEMPEDLRRAISSFEVEQRTTGAGQTRTLCRLRFWSKTDALEKLAKVDRREVEGKGSFTLNVKVGPPRPAKGNGDG